MGDEGDGEPRPAEVRGGAALDPRERQRLGLPEAREVDGREGRQTRRHRGAARRCRRRRRGPGRGPGRGSGEAVLDVAPHVLLQDPALASGAGDLGEVRPQLPCESPHRRGGVERRRAPPGEARQLRGWRRAAERSGRPRVADAPPVPPGCVGLDGQRGGLLRGLARARGRLPGGRPLRLCPRGTGAGRGGGGPARRLASGGCCRGLRGRFPRPLLARIRRFEHEEHVPLGDLVPELHPELRDHPRGRGGDVHRRLVALESEERVVEFHPVPGGDQKLDHRDPGEVPDVRDRDLDSLRHARRRSSRPPFASGSPGAAARGRRGSAGWRRGPSRRGAARRRRGP